MTAPQDPERVATAIEPAVAPDSYAPTDATPPTPPPRPLETTASAAVAPPESPADPPATRPGQMSLAAAVAPIPTRALRPYEPFRECLQCPEMVDQIGRASCRKRV